MPYCKSCGNFYYGKKYFESQTCYFCREIKRDEMTTNSADIDAIENHFKFLNNLYKEVTQIDNMAPNIGEIKIDVDPSNEIFGVEQHETDDVGVSLPDAQAQGAESIRKKEMIKGDQPIVVVGNGVSECALSTSHIAENPKDGSSLPIDINTGYSQKDQPIEDKRHEVTCSDEEDEQFYSVASNNDIPETITFQQFCDANGGAYEDPLPSPIGNNEDMGPSAHNNLRTWCVSFIPCAVVLVSVACIAYIIIKGSLEGVF